MLTIPTLIQQYGGRIKVVALRMLITANSKNFVLEMVLIQIGIILLRGDVKFMKHRELAKLMFITETQYVLMKISNRKMSMLNFMLLKEVIIIPDLFVHRIVNQD